MHEPKEVLQSVTETESHGRMYWAMYHLRQSVWLPLNRFMDRRPLRSALIILVLFWLVFLWERQEWQILVLYGRKHIENLFIIPLIAFVVWWLLKNAVRHHFAGMALRGVAAVLLVVCTFKWGSDLHDYASYWWQYQVLDIVELDELPITNDLRIQPFKSIAALALENMQDAEAPSAPDFVRGFNGEYQFTMAIEPHFDWQIWSGISGHVNELIVLPGTSPSVVFTGHKVPVSFDVSENRYLSHNAHTCTVRGFGLWRFINYEPSNVLYVQDDQGVWVEVVTLIRWRGIIFPRPEFGGVQIIRQHQDGLIRNTERVLFGCGEWIPPEEVSKYKFLVGQNILSDAVARYIGESFRFKNGFFAPMASIHSGDIRIPDLPSVVDSQPFTAVFTLPGQKEGKLYKYFGLEPYAEDKQGLVVSLFIPADGLGPVFMYDHVKHGESPVGVSGVGAKVEESKKNYNWKRNRPVEHRPFIQDIDGVRRFFWITTIVTSKDEAGGTQFIAGSTPDLAITDPYNNKTVWVDPQHPELWTEQLKAQLDHIWKTK